MMHGPINIGNEHNLTNWDDEKIEFTNTLLVQIKSTLALTSEAQVIYEGLGIF